MDLYEMHQRRTHLTVFSGTSHTSGLVFGPSKYDNRVKDLDVRHMRTIMEKALGEEGESGQLEMTFARDGRNPLLRPPQRRLTRRWHRA
jgi:hypothetical protein